MVPVADSTLGGVYMHESGGESLLDVDRGILQPVVVSTSARAVGTRCT